MNKSVKKNYIFNLVYQIFLLITPFLTTPYVSRVLLSDGIGKYSFSFAIVNYFILFASFGFAYYAQREIAKFSGNKYEQSKVFWEIFILRSLTTSMSLIIFLGLIFSNALASYNILLIILAVSIISVAVDPSYILQGNEDFEKLTLPNIIVRCLSIVSIFLFVKNRSHLWIYTLIGAGCTILSNVILWFYSTKYLTKVNIKKLEVKKHFIPALKLFIPTIAISIYTLLDRTLIGLMLPTNVADSNVGFYDSAEKIVKMALTVVTALGAVMIPNNAKYYSNKDYEKLNKNIETAVKFSALLGFPIMFGLAAIASNFVPWFFGPGYEYVVNLMEIFSLLIIFIGLSSVYGTQYLIATNKENILTASVTVGAIINLTLNLITIPRFGVMGAALSTVIAEAIILLYQMISLRKIFSIRKTIKRLIKFAFSGIVMFVVVKLISLYLRPAIINTIVLVLIGAFVYFLLLFLLREKFFIQVIKGALAKISLKRKEGSNKIS